MVSSPGHMIALFLACVVASSLFIPSSMATRFDVGGKDGWVVKPSESYDHWAQRLRFLVNDSLVFRYKQGSDSVVQVKKEDYDTCDTSKKLKIMRSGTSVFPFTRSGPFYFISGNKKQCLNGQKLVVVVLAVRSPPAAPKTPTTPTPPPSSAAPALPPTASPPPSSGAGSPKLAPQPPPAASSPSTAPSNSNAPAASWKSPAGQPGASPPAPPAGETSPPAGSPGAAEQTSPPPVASQNSSPSPAAAVASPVLVAVGLGFLSLFM